MQQDLPSSVPIHMIERIQWNYIAAITLPDDQKLCLSKSGWIDRPLGTDFRTMIEYREMMDKITKSAASVFKHWRDTQSTPGEGFYSNVNWVRTDAPEGSVPGKYCINPGWQEVAL